MISLRTPLIAATVALAGWAGTAQAQANVTYAAPGAAISVQFGAPPPCATRPFRHRAAAVGAGLLAPAGPPPCLGGRPLGQGAPRLCVPPARVVAARWPLGLRTRPLGP